MYARVGMRVGLRDYGGCMMNLHVHDAFKRTTPDEADASSGVVCFRSEIFPIISSCGCRNGS